MADNLVLYNIDRVKRMSERWMKDEGSSSWLGEDYDAILSALDFIKREMERNYNPKAHLKCGWCGCKETFDGWLAHKRLVKHEVDTHPDKCQAQMTLAAGAMALIVDSLLSAPDRLVNSGRASREYARLKKKGKDIPVALMQDYYKEHNEYMDTQDPKRKWHEPIEFTPPEGVDAILGRNTLIRETIRGLWRALHPDKDK